MRHTRAYVDLAALAANFKAISTLLSDSAAGTGRRTPRAIAVVKANGYGHGAVPVARTLEQAGAWMLAVADASEGVALREAGIRVPILVFGVMADEVEGIFTHDLTPGITTPEAARAVSRAAAARGVRVGCHLKIDTGMHRMGLRHDTLRDVAPSVLADPHLEVRAVYTHFATAENHEHPLYDDQRRLFDDACRELTGIGLGDVPRHAANSAALLRDERVWFDAVRPGLVLYGVVPPPGFTTLPVRPVMSIHSRLVAVKPLLPGEHVGYGARFTAEGGTRTIGVIPAGYADGIDTRLANRGFVLVRGRRAPVVGSVCMDMIMADVTGLDAAPGDEVVLIGRQGDEVIDAREVAATVGTIPWDVLCRVGNRVERVYV